MPVAAEPALRRPAILSLIGTYLSKPDSPEAPRMLKEAAGDGALLPAEDDLFKLLGHVVNNLVESGDVEQAKADLRMCEARIHVAITALSNLVREGDSPFIGAAFPCCRGLTPGEAGCACGNDERALRFYINHPNEQMTPGEREWCVREVTISSYAEYSSAMTREAADALASHKLARAVLDCWRDLVRDKGVY